MAEDHAALIRTFHASCHCKSSRFTFTLPVAQLPIKAHFCRCSICRYTHGSLFTLHAPIPQPTVDLSTFTIYEATPGRKKYFCSTCGAHMLDHGEEDDEKDWYVAVALVEAEEEAWEWKGHYFVGSTVDGGIATLLHEFETTSGKKNKLPLHDGWGTKDEKYTESGDWVRPRKDEGRTTGENKDGQLRAQCHCGGISFFISRPTGPAAFENVKDEGLIPKDKTKWFGSYDACESCRLVVSTPIVAWIFPTPSSITMANGTPYPENGIIGSAKHYSTSHGVHRTFCGTCGATITYGCDDRKELIDIAAGLLRADSGARAEDWIEWRTWRLSYEEDAKLTGLVGSLRKALSASIEHENIERNQTSMDMGKEKL